MKGGTSFEFEKEADSFVCPIDIHAGLLTGIRFCGQCRR